MAEAVVDRLEPVEVAVQHRDRPSVATQPSERPIESFAELHAVGQPRQLIVVDQLPELRLGALQLFASLGFGRDVEHSGHVADHMTVVVGGRRPQHPNPQGGLAGTIECRGGRLAVSFVGGPQHVANRLAMGGAQLVDPGLVVIGIGGRAEQLSGQVVAEGEMAPGGHEQTRRSHLGQRHRWVGVAVGPGVVGLDGEFDAAGDTADGGIIGQPGRRRAQPPPGLLDQGVAQPVGAGDLEAGVGDELLGRLEQ